MRVYALNWWACKRDSVLLDPDPDPVEATMAKEAGFYTDEIHRFVVDYFYGHTDIFGITREFAKLFMLREFLKLKYVSGFSSDVALTGAKVNFKAFMSARAAAIGWVAIGVVIAAALLGIVFAIDDWTEKSDGMIRFPMGCVILRYGERLWWGGVIGHPSDREWVFTRCKLLGDVFFFERRATPGSWFVYDRWDFYDTWEAKIERFIGWYVYRFGVLESKYLGVAHYRGYDSFTLTLPDGEPQPYPMPVSWGIREFYACKYLFDWNDYFV